MISPPDKRHALTTDASAEATVTEVRRDGVKCATCGDSDPEIVIMGTDDLSYRHASPGDCLYCYGCGGTLFVMTDT